MPAVPIPATVIFLIKDRREFSIFIQFEFIVVKIGRNLRIFKKKLLCVRYARLYGSCGGFFLRFVYAFWNYILPLRRNTNKYLFSMIFNCKKSVYGALEIPDSLKSLRSEKLGIFSTHTHTHTHTRALSKSFSANKTTKRTSFFLCLCLSAVCSSLSAQVGIRTEDPRGMLHVDAKGDTRISASDTVNISDDVVVTPEGRIGPGPPRPC